MAQATETALPDLGRPALIVADLQRDFLAADGALARAGRRPLDDAALAGLLGNLRRVTAAMRERGRPVIAARTAVRSDSADCAWGPGWVERTFGADRGALVEGGDGVRWIDGFAPADGDVVLTKTGHSAFFGTPLDRILANLGCDTLLLAGGPLADTLSDTARNGAALGYRVFLLGDAVFPPLASYPRGSAAKPVTIESALAALAALAAVGAARAPTARSALLIVDMQTHFLFPERGGPAARAAKAAESAAIVRNVARLADAARGAGWPVIWVRTGRRADRADTAMHRLREEILLDDGNLLIDGTPVAEFAEGLRPAAEDLVLAKRGQSAFAFTPLHRVLRNLGVGRCVLAGDAASGCLSATLRDGAALGYRFAVASDAVYPAASPYLAVLAERAPLRATAALVAELGAQAS